MLDHSGLQSRPFHSCSHLLMYIRVQQRRNQFVLLRVLGNNLCRCDLHLVVDAGRTYIEGAAEETGKGEVKSGPPAPPATGNETDVEAEGGKNNA